jgi:hypothetical protein
MMLPSISYVYEQATPEPFSMATIELSFAETQMLVELSEQAKAAAPMLGKVLRARILQFAYAYPMCSMQDTDLALYLQDWFLQLFQVRSEEYFWHHETNYQLPLNLIMTGVDLILSFGYEICQYSLNPKGAIRAFHKALALKVTSGQMASQADAAEHFYELLLLD